MSNISIFLAFILASILLVWLAIPLIRGVKRSAMVTLVEQQRTHLQYFYARVLQNLHDIDEDFATGKLNAEQHLRLREQWMQRGIQALKALDSLQEDQLLVEETAEGDSLDHAIEQRIEAAVLSSSETEN